MLLALRSHSGELSFSVQFCYFCHAVILNRRIAVEPRRPVQKSLPDAATAKSYPTAKIASIYRSIDFYEPRSAILRFEATARGFTCTCHRPFPFTGDLKRIDKSLELFDGLRKKHFSVRKSAKLHFERRLSALPLKQYLLGFAPGSFKRLGVDTAVKIFFALSHRLSDQLSQHWRMLRDYRILRRLKQLDVGKNRCGDKRQYNRYRKFLHHIHPSIFGLPYRRKSPYLSIHALAHSTASRFLFTSGVQWKTNPSILCER